MTNRRQEIFERNLHQVYAQTDQMFLWLLQGQWLFAIAVAVVRSPYTWSGSERSVHPHVFVALLLGGLLNVMPVVLIRLAPGWWLTRQSIAVAQVMWSAILIHITGGRIETHFHVFGSLAFLAFYRDWRLLGTATMTVAADHLVRGFFWPDSVYGIANPEWWRFLEHASWIAFEDVVLVLGCHRALSDMRATADREAELAEINGNIETQVRERTEELRDNMERYRSLVENTNAVPWEFDRAKGELTYLAPQAARFCGASDEKSARRIFLGEAVHPDDRKLVETRLGLHLSKADSAAGRAESIAGDQFDYRMISGTGAVHAVRTVLSPIGHGEPLRGITIDVTQQKQLESELHQAQKLESIGRLAAGVAHEINTPVQFVNDSVHFLRDASTDVFHLVGALQKVQQSVLAGEPAEDAAAEAIEAAESADLEYLMENVPKAFERSIDGLSRVATIVRSMKEFAHPDSKEMAPVDLNRAVESTLTIARNEYKYVADLMTEFGSLPPVMCLAGEINQVVLNIVVNAAHAIGERVKDSGERGRITVRTALDGVQAVIAIEDTGGGIPEQIRDRIFDPFFTTKGVGKGTGQGLAISRHVVVEKHQGELSFVTRPGEGTTFLIKLPVNGSAVRNKDGLGQAEAAARPEVAA